MTTRDSRPNDPPWPGTPVGPGEREPTQSLRLEPGEQPSPAALAFGTHNRQVTSIESPNGRGKTPPLPLPPNTPVMPVRPTEPLDGYVGAVLGSYRVIELLGRGGMGHVYRAEHVKLGREVALKLLRSDYASRRDAVARFFQEARTVNRVRHRNIVDVTDFVELDDGTTFIIMELLAGASLGAWAKTGIDLPRALAVLVQICDGLAAAHQVGVVHRDLKPDNVIVVPTSDGADLVKLLDFGVAKLLNRDDEDVGFQTAAGAVIGTPAYMSPEQAGGMVIDARSDIYSLGAIMYELFCGQLMFRGRSFGEFVRKHLTEIPVPPRQTPGGAGIPPELEAVILKALEKDAEQRYATIGELRDALLSLLGSMAPQIPSIAVMTGSGLRPHLTQLPRLPQGVYAPSQIAQLSQISGLSGAHAVQGRLGGQQSYPPSSTPRPRTPRWVRFAGGALAVGIGATAAIWYAGHGGPSLPPSPAAAATQPALPAVQPAAQPTAQPIDPPATHPQHVEVRFDSLPSGSVFAEGQSAELCRTPCAVNIDLTDGGPTDRRDFVVKREGYDDGTITVDLTGDKREFHVMLQHAATASPADDQHTEPTASDQDAVKTDPRLEKRPAKHPARPGKATRTTRRDDKDGKDTKDTKDTTKDGATTPDTRDTRDTRDTKDTREPDRDHLLDPDDGAPGTPKKPPARPTIDPSDTLDPFHRKQ